MEKLPFRTLFYRDSVKFQAVIKSAASAASRKTKNQGPRSRGAQPSPVVRLPSRRPWTPLHGSWSLIFGLPGSCASSRLDHGLKFYGIRRGCASSRLISEFSDSVCSRANCFALHGNCFFTNFMCSKVVHSLSYSGLAEKLFGFEGLWELQLLSLLQCQL